jgi:hypothetical protein
MKREDTMPAQPNTEILELTGGQLALVVERLKLLSERELRQDVQNSQLDALGIDIRVLQSLLAQVGSVEQFNISRLNEIRDRLSYNLAELELQVRTKKNRLRGDNLEEPDLLQEISTDLDDFDELLSSFRATVRVLIQRIRSF